jgi:hypothetical protein
VPLVRAGLLRRTDWQGAAALPCTLLRDGWRRMVRESQRGAPDAMDLHLVLEPWAYALDGVGERVTRADRACLSVTIDAGRCVIVPLDDVRARWGEDAACVVATALRRGLGHVVNVWDPDDLDWVAEWWQDRMELYDDDDDAEAQQFEANRLQEFAAAQEEVRRCYLDLRSRASLAHALRALPAGVARRSAAALLSEARAPAPLWPSKAWDRMQGGEEGYPTAAVVITKHADDAVRHAYDEVQETTMNSGYSSPPHAVLLLDTRTPARLAGTLLQLRRVLRTLAWGERLVRALQELPDTR